MGNNSSNSMAERTLSPPQPIIPRIIDPRNVMLPSQQIPMSPQQYYLMFNAQHLPFGQRFPNQPPLYNRQQTAPPPPQVEQTIMIKNDVNLKRNSMKMELVEGSTSRYRLSFTLDLATDCLVKILYAASEVKDEERLMNFTTPSEHYALPPVIVPKGLGQQFRQSDEHAFDIDMLPLYLRGEGPSTASSTYSVIVILEATESESTGASSSTSPEPETTLRKHVQCQYTYAQIVKGDGATYQIKPIKQKVQVNADTFELQEIFGLETQQTATPDSENEALCIICMGSVRDTTVLPCRHMCLCSDCAKTLRLQTNKCPICRTVINGLLQIKISQQGTEREEVLISPPIKTSDQDQNEPSVSDSSKAQS